MPKPIGVVNIGTDWTTNEDSADCYDTHNVIDPDASVTFVLETDVPKSHIDWISTIANNIHPSFGEDEQEVNLIKGKKIKIKVGEKSIGGKV